MMRQPVATVAGIAFRRRRPKSWRALSSVLTVVLGVTAVSGPVFAQDHNLAQALVDTGNYSGAELDFWVIAARHHRDRVEWRRIIERETQRLEAEQVRKDAQELARIVLPMEDYLAQQDAYRLADEARALDAQATLNAGKLARESEARRQLVSGETGVVQAVERWARVVVDSTGEVIENDPIDVAHARLEDLIRRQDELDLRMRSSPDADEFAAIIDELRAMDSELDDVLSQVGGAVWRSRSKHQNTCFPGPVPDQPVAVFNCHYWAAGLPRVLNATQNLILDRIRLDVDEDEDDLPVGVSIAYFWRYGGEPASDEPASGNRAEIRHQPDGRLSLVFVELDDNGNERERSYPLTLSERSATATLPGFDGYGPFSLTFARDEANYVPWPDYQAAARGQAPDYRRGASDIYDLDLPPLSSDPVSSDDEVELVPLTTDDEVELVPLTTDDEIELVPLTPAQDSSPATDTPRRR